MRYILLVILSMPIILMAMLNVVTQYKLDRVTVGRFRQQLILWLIILVALVGSFPSYNYLSGRPLLDSHTFSAFDIVEITAIVYLIYIVNDHRRKIEQNEKIIRELHQQISIRLASDATKQSKK